MKYLFDRDGSLALDAFCMANCLFAFDYDGTLAPIVDEPQKAFMRPSTSRFLTEINQLTPVAVISGRSRDDVRRFLPNGIDYIIGNHGLEGLPSGGDSLGQAEASSEKWRQQMAAISREKGIVIEDKKYSLAVHYRLSSNKRAAKSLILDTVSRLSPSPRIVLGKCVVNLISPGAPHKGIALLEVMLRSGCRTAVYVGDDDNDEDVFRLAEESLLTIRVGENTDSGALFYLKSQNEIEHLMQLWLHALMKSGKRPRVNVQSSLRNDESYQK